MDFASGPVVRRIVALGWLLVIAALGAAEPATVAMVTGHPRIVRDGRPLARRVEPGFGLENFDAIRTDGRTTLELTFDRPPGLDVVARVEPLSHLSIEVPASFGEPVGVIRLIAGSVEVSVRDLPEGWAFQVRSSAAVVHARGSRFSVTLAADGTMLVLAEAGVVEVRGPRGPTLYSRRGEAVEIDVDADHPRNLRFDAEPPAGFRRAWLDRRAELAAARASELTRLRGQAYLAARDAFTAAYADVMGHRDTIDEWLDAAERGVACTGRPGDEDHRLYESLGRAHASMADFEPLYAILDSLAPDLGGDAAAIQIDHAHTAADLIRMAANDRRLMDARFATVRHILKLSVASAEAAP